MRKTQIFLKKFSILELELKKKRKKNFFYIQCCSSIEVMWWK